MGHWNSPGRLQQSASSWPLAQLVVPSHTSDLSMHSPDWQLNWSARQVGQPTSSDLSGQSFCPSQRHEAGMQSLFTSLIPDTGAAHVKWSGPQAGKAPQFSLSSSNIRCFGQEQTSRVLAIPSPLAIQMCEHLVRLCMHVWFRRTFGSGVQTARISVIWGRRCSSADRLSPFTVIRSTPVLSSSQ